METGEKSLPLAYGINPLIRQEKHFKWSRTHSTGDFSPVHSQGTIHKWQIITGGGLLEYHALGEMNRLHITLGQTDHDCDSWIISLWAAIREMNVGNVTLERHPTPHTALVSHMRFHPVISKALMIRSLWNTYMESIKLQIKHFAISNGSEGDNASCQDLRPKTQEVKKSLIFINQVIRLSQIHSKYIFSRFYLM